MQNSSSISQLQKQLGRELVAELIRDVPTAELEAVLLDEAHPFAVYLQTAVRAAVDAAPRLAREIVVSELELELALR